MISQNIEDEKISRINRPSELTLDHPTTTSISILILILIWVSTSTPTPEHNLDLVFWLVSILRSVACYNSSFPGLRLKLDCGRPPFLREKKRSIIGREIDLFRSNYSLTGDISMIKSFTIIFISNARHSTEFRAIQTTVLSFKYFRISSRDFGSIENLKKEGDILYTSLRRNLPEEANATLRRVSEFRMGL